MRIPGGCSRARVTSIRKAPINVQNVITYDAVIGVSNADLKLFPGMTANVKILVNQRHERAEGPQRRAALSPGVGDRGGRRPTGAAQGRRHRRRRSGFWTRTTRRSASSSRTGETDGTFTEVTGGSLKDGDRVIVAALAKTAPRPAAARLSAAGGGRGPGF